MSAQDFILVLKDALSSVPFVLPVVIGLVQWSKVTFRLTDDSALNGLAMLFGVLFGGAFMLALRLPESFAQWFVLVFFGVVLGLAASGMYKVGASFADRASSVVVVPDTKGVLTSAIPGTNATVITSDRVQ